MNANLTGSSSLAVLLAVAGLSAPSHADVTLSIDVPPAAPGERTMAAITLQQAVGLAGAEFVVTMPEFVVPGQAQPLPPTAEFEVASRAEPGRIAIALACGQGMSQERVTILQFPLVLAATAPSGKFNLVFEGVLVCDTQPKPMAVQLFPGTLQVLKPPEDWDQDGLPDQWETRLFGTTSGSPQADSDDDGLTDSAEFIAGTDPRSPESVFRIRNVENVTQASGRKVLLEWEGEESRRYEVQWSDGPVSENMTWHRVYNPDIRHSGSLWSWTDDGTRTHVEPEMLPERYYRVVLVE
jgi:hypothetical protein